MITLSISIPKNLAKASQDAAQKLGLSRAEFIRQAISHEVEKLSAQCEQESMVRSFVAMKNSKAYLAEAEEIIEGFNDKDENSL